jgi:hypothetical protein
MLMMLTAGATSSIYTAHVPYPILPFALIIARAWEQRNTLCEDV